MATSSLQHIQFFLRKLPPNAVNGNRAMAANGSDRAVINGNGATGGYVNGTVNERSLSYGYGNDVASAEDYWSRFKTYSTIQRTLEIWGFVVTFIFKAWLSNQKFSYKGTPDDATRLVSKQGSCWYQLKLPGMVQWGQRRQFGFLGRDEEQKIESLQELHKGKGVIVEHREGTNEKKRKKGEEEMEAVKVASFGVKRMARQSKKGNISVSSGSGVQISKKAKNDPKKQQLLVHGKNKRKITIGRWSAERYKLAEENLLKVMKEKGAVFGNPILRPDLRSETRKHIGDTGLLDHLLKHMAGKVAPGGTERFRRRHNAEGAMEYWLESAELVDIRKQAGVQDPYWTPPPGWKPGDSISSDCVSNRELKEIKEEILKLKQDMRELTSKKEEEALAIVTQGEQLKEISLTLSGMKAQLGILKQTVVPEEPIMSESFGGPKSLGENIEGVTREEKKGNNDNKATESADTQMQGSTAAEDIKAAKIERLKSDSESRRNINLNEPPLTHE